MKQKKVPMRRCLGCMESKPKQELIRVVADGDSLVLDKSGKANGRGTYICKDGKCMSFAIKKKAFQRALGIDVTNENLETLLEEVISLEEENR